MAPMTKAERLRAIFMAEFDRHTAEIDDANSPTLVAVSWTRQHNKPPIIEFTLAERRVAQEWGAE